MKEDYRIFGDVRPSFKRAVEKQRQEIAALDDYPEQKRDAEAKLFERLSLVHQRSTVRQRQINVAIQAPSALLKCRAVEPAEAWKLSIQTSERGRLQRENAPTYSYALRIMKELRQPVAA